MTIDDLVAECWFDLPPLRKRIVGRDAVKAMLVDAIAEWNTNEVLACQGDGDIAAYEAQLVGRVQRRREEYGFVLMSIILTAVLVAVVQWLVKWWLDRHFNQECIERWHLEMTS